MNTPVLNSLTEVINSIRYIIPETVIALLIIVVLVTDLIIDKKGRFLFPVIIFAGLLAASWFLFLQVGYIREKNLIISFSGLIRLDSLALVFKFIFILAGFLFTVLSMIESKPRLFKSESEYYIIFLGILLGTFMMVMASNLLSIYISIELVSISSYMLTIFNFNRKGFESALKYLLFGAVASAVMLYGISLLYGFTGTLNIFSEDFIIRLQAVPALPRFLALLMTFSGFLFKMAVVPFHIWTPDVYEGAPVSLIAFFSVVPKLAGLIIFARFFYIVNNHTAGIDWRSLFGIISLLSMFIGNLGAIWQKDAKRMMAYSSIAHSGYLMVGILALSVWGLQSVAIHASVYLIMNFLVFMIIELYSPVIGGTEISGYSGHFRSSPIYASLLIIGFLSLVGLPPTGGFTSKMMLFSSAWYSYSQGGEKILLWLVILGLINTLFSLYYYLRIPYFMVFKDQVRDSPGKITIRSGFLGLGLFLTALIIIIFIKPDWLVDLLNNLNFTYRGINQ